MRVAYLIFPFRPVLLLVGQLVGGGGGCVPRSPLAARSPAGWVVNQGEGAGAGAGRCVPRSPGPALHPRFRLVSFPPPRRPVSSTPSSCPIVSLSCCVIPSPLWYVVSLVVLLPPLLLWWWCGLGSRGPGRVRLGQVVRVVVVVGTRGMVRVPHGYTAGRVFAHRTRTRVHRNPQRVRPVPYHNSRGV